MSLASALAQTARPRLPEAVLLGCLEADRVVVDNIVLVALEFVRMLSGTLIFISHSFPVSLRPVSLHMCVCTCSRSLYFQLCSLSLYSTSLH